MHEKCNRSVIVIRGACFEFEYSESDKIFVGCPLNNPTVKFCGKSIEELYFQFVRKLNNNELRLTTMFKNKRKSQCSFRYLFYLFIFFGGQMSTAKLKCESFQLYDDVYSALDEGVSIKQEFNFSHTVNKR
jgi:hypothetical protein